MIKEKNKILSKKKKRKSFFIKYFEKILFGILGNFLETALDIQK